MDDIENVEMLYIEAARIEDKAHQLGNLENLCMHKNGFYEMANYETEDSGLPYAIWFEHKGRLRNNKHFIPRVKVTVSNDNMIPVSIEEFPKILLKGVPLSKAERELKGKSKKIIFNFISHNHNLILQHWDGKITTKMLFERLETSTP